MLESWSIDISIERYGNEEQSLIDSIAIEEPLEIRFQGKSLSITMRTPGEDRFLAAGFLFTEGILHRPCQIEDMVPCGKIIRLGPHGYHNIIKVILRPGEQVILKGPQRNFYTTSSCGLCGKASLEALLMNDCLPFLEHEGSIVKASTLLRMPRTLRGKQILFQKTGGLHASALFDEQGHLLELFEDVGRHNALDKLIGHQFLHGKLPLSSRVLLLSGRVSFELIQKALRAGISIVAAVGAPSSLAVDAAKKFNMTLIGFIKEKSFNIYCGKQRIIQDEIKNF